jgi:hypothetical protein
MVAALTGPVVRLNTAGGSRSHMATTHPASMGTPSSGRDHAATPASAGAAGLAPVARQLDGTTVAGTDGGDSPAIGGVVSSL